jgi:hypothetical protein
MVLNIGKYLLPTVEYNLFKNYIAENLCVKKNEANNCCQGKCYLEKQINLVNETGENSTNPTQEKQINWQGADDYIFEKSSLQTPNPLTKIQLSTLVDFHITKMRIDVLCPPPKRFI